MERRTKIYRIAAIGVFAALTFAGNKIEVPIPVAIGDISRIHFGNIVCLLSGFVLGPIGGGLAAGRGAVRPDEPGVYCQRAADVPVQVHAGGGMRLGGECAWGAGREPCAECVCGRGG